MNLKFQVTDTENNELYKIKNILKNISELELQSYFHTSMIPPYIQLAARSEKRSSPDTAENYPGIIIKFDIDLNKIDQKDYLEKTNLLNFCKYSSIVDDKNTAVLKIVPEKDQYRISYYTFNKDTNNFYFLQKTSEKLFNSFKVEKLIGNSFLDKKGLYLTTNFYLPRFLFTKAKYKIDQIMFSDGWMNSSDLFRPKKLIKSRILTDRNTSIFLHHITELFGFKTLIYLLQELYPDVPKDVDTYLKTSFFMEQDISKPESFLDAFSFENIQIDYELTSRNDILYIGDISKHILSFNFYNFFKKNIIDPFSYGMYSFLISNGKSSFAYENFANNTLSREQLYTHKSYVNNVEITALPSFIIIEPGDNLQEIIQDFENQYFDEMKLKWERIYRFWDTYFPNNELVKYMLALHYSVDYLLPTIYSTRQFFYNLSTQSFSNFSLNEIDYFASEVFDFWNYFDLDQAYFQQLIKGIKSLKTEAYHTQKLISGNIRIEKAIWLGYGQNQDSDIFNKIIPYHKYPFYFETNSFYFGSLKGTTFKEIEKAILIDDTNKKTTWKNIAKYAIKTLELENSSVIILRFENILYQKMAKKIFKNSPSVFFLSDFQEEERENRKLKTKKTIVNKNKLEEIPAINLNVASNSQASKLTPVPIPLRNIDISDPETYLRENLLFLTYIGNKQSVEFQGQKYLISNNYNRENAVNISYWMRFCKTVFNRDLLLISSRGLKQLKNDYGENVITLENFVNNINYDDYQIDFDQNYFYVKTENDANLINVLSYYFMESVEFYNTRRFHPFTYDYIQKWIRNYEVLKEVEDKYFSVIKRMPSEIQAIFEQLTFILFYSRNYRQTTHTFYRQLQRPDITLTDYKSIFLIEENLQLMEKEIIKGFAKNTKPFSSKNPNRYIKRLEELDLPNNGSELYGFNLYDYFKDISVLLENNQHINLGKEELHNAKTTIDNFYDMRHNILIKTFEKLESAL